MQRLLDTFSEYSSKWMLNFNPKKCKCIVFGDSSFDEFEFKLSNQSLEIVEEIKILGFVFKSPYFNENEFIREKFHSVRKAFYSLHSFGMKPNGLNHFLQIFLYKTFCLSKIHYGMELFSLKLTTFKKLNSFQNSLIRYHFKLPKFSHMTNLLCALNIFDF